MKKAFVGKEERTKLAFEGWWLRYGSDDKEADQIAFRAGWMARAARQQKQGLRIDEIRESTRAD